MSAMSGNKKNTVSETLDKFLYEYLPAALTVVFVVHILPALTDGNMKVLDTSNLRHALVLVLTLTVTFLMVDRFLPAFSASLRLGAGFVMGVRAVGGLLTTAH
jgi:hypothetical protein